MPKMKNLCCGAIFLNGKEQLFRLVDESITRNLIK